MTDVICLQCWAMLHQIRPAHRDWELYHPPPAKLPRIAAPRGPIRYPFQTFDTDSTNQPAITYPDSDIQ